MTRIGPFAGINNRLPENQLAVYERGRKVGDWLRNAVDVDLTNAGTLQARQGATLAQSGAACHSLWGDEYSAYYADGATLYTLPRTPIATGLTPGRPVAYVRMPTGDVVWSDGVRIECVGGLLGVPRLNPSPVATPSSGSMPAGEYLIAFTAIDEAGRESGSTAPQRITLGGSAGVLVSGLTRRTAIYLSHPDGTTLYFVAETSGPTLSITSARIEYGREIQTLMLADMPPGHILAEFNGRLVVADRNGLYYSEPYGYGLYNPSRNYIPMQDLVMVAPAQTGLYLVTRERHYWLSGVDVDAPERMIELFPFGAVPGTRMRLNEGWAWMSNKGLVVADMQGQARLVQDDALAHNPAASGAALYREHDGMRQAVVVLNGVMPTTRATKNYRTAEDNRKENT